MDFARLLSLFLLGAVNFSVMGIKEPTFNNPWPNASRGQVPPNPFQPDSENHAFYTRMSGQSSSQPQPGLLESCGKEAALTLVGLAVSALWYRYYTNTQTTDPELEAKIRAEKLAHEAVITTAQERFNECLHNHKNDITNDDGIPVTCEKFAADLLKVVQNTKA